MSSPLEQLNDENFLVYVKKFCYSKINFHNHDGEDAVQGAILKIFLNRHKYKSISNCTFRTWALTVARNYCLDFVTKQQTLNKRTVSVDSLEPHIAENMVSIEFDNRIERDQDEEIHKHKLNIDIENLKKHLETFPERSRQVVLLRHQHGSEQTAKLLNISQHNVRQIYYRVLGQLQAKMLTKSDMDLKISRFKKTKVKRMYTARRKLVKTERLGKSRAKQMVITTGMQRFADRRAEARRLKEEQLKKSSELKEFLKNYNWDLV